MATSQILLLIFQRSPCGDFLITDVARCKIDEEVLHKSQTPCGDFLITDSQPHQIHSLPLGNLSKTCNAFH